MRVPESQPHGAARKIFSNTCNFNGLEVWRKIHALIFATNERRQDEPYDKIHKPKVAANAGEVAGALEDWDTNQKLHRGVGGVPLREEELRNLLLKMLPSDMKIHVLQNIRSFPSWEDLKDYVRDHARLVMVHITKSVPTHLAEMDNVNLSITEILERTDGWTLPDQLLELGFTPDSEVYTAVMNKLITKKNIWRGRKGRKFDKGNGKGVKGVGKGGRVVPTSKDGKPICVNCSKVGHDQTKCPKQRMEAKD